MERFKLECIISGNAVELQFDIKKMPDQQGPCYMITIDGLFKGYLKKESNGDFSQLMNTDFSDYDWLIISDRLKRLL